MQEDERAANAAEWPPISRKTLTEIAAALSIPAPRREAAAPEIEKIIGIFQRHGSGSPDYFSPGRMAEQSERIATAAAALVEVILDAHERTVMEFNIICRKVFPGLDFIEMASGLASIADRVALNCGALKRKASALPSPAKVPGRPRSLGLGDEGLPACEWFIKDIARLAYKHGGWFPADKNEGEGKWKRLRELVEPGLPKGFFVGLTNGRRAIVARQGVSTEKNYLPKR